ncbi:MAG TPA: FecR domain-containing protein [Cyclobacteriaceae bacterium]|nr:FecR domain-containing protein [Cyclobacteriaceae bacterium]
MEYEDFSTDDFVSDGFFIRWAKGDSEAAWFWNSFLEQHPKKAEDIQQARQVILALEYPKRTIAPSDRAVMKNKLILTLKAQRERESDHTKSYLSYKRKTRIWYAAASILLLTAMIVFMMNYESDFVEQLSNAAKTSTAPTEQTQQQSVPRGQMSVTTLADGTKVWLKADSKLTYANDFVNHETREVFLDGEAFFEVAHDASKPFIVHTSEINIKVLGTSFNVKSYSNEKKIETTLLEGKVRINRAGETGDETSLVLKPNQKAVFERETKMMDVEQVQAEKTISWRDERLVFEDADYEDVFTELERWYDVKIIVEATTDPHCKLNANIGRETLEEVLNLIMTSDRVSYTISDKEVHIKGTLCN